jgi:hypothetical protein
MRLRLRQKSRRFWLLALGSIVLAGAGLFAADYFYQLRKLQSRLEAIRAKGEPVTFAELNQWHEPVDDDQNICLAIEKANVLWVDSPLGSDIRVWVYPVARWGEIKEGVWAPWNGVIPADAAQYLQSNIPFEAAVHSALQLSGSRSRTTYAYSDPPKDDRVGEIFQSAKHVLSYRAKACSAVGDGEGSVAAIINLVNVCRAQEREPSSEAILIDQSAITEACALANMTLSECRLSSRAAQNLQNTFDEYLSSIDVARVAKMMRCSGFCRAESQMTISIYAPFWPRAGNRILDGFERYARALELSPTEYVSEWMALFTDIIPVSYSDNEIYRILTNMQRTPDMAALEQLRYSIVANRGNEPDMATTIAGIAVYRYWLDNGFKLPQTLNELQPEYVTSVPTFWLDGQPLRIKICHDGYVVYTQFEADNTVATIPDDQIEQGCSYSPNGGTLFRVTLAPPPSSSP